MSTFSQMHESDRSPFVNIKKTHESGRSVFLNKRPVLQTSLIGGGLVQFEKWHRWGTYFLQEILASVSALTCASSIHLGWQSKTRPIVLSTHAESGGPLLSQIRGKLRIRSVRLFLKFPKTEGESSWCLFHQIGKLQGRVLKLHFFVHEIPL